MSLSLAVVHGPNLHRLGQREIRWYGSKSWVEIWQELKEWGKAHHTDLTYFQSNSEGALIDHLYEMDSKVDGILLNPAAYSHTSIALRDCVASLSLPVVEVHLSKLSKREDFRHHSFIADVAQASIVGFGADGYLLGLELLHSLLTHDT